MQKLFLLLISLIILFAGCLLQPQVQIKTLVAEEGKVFVGLTTNKALSAEIKILNDAGTILCSDKVNLKQGTQTVKLTCELTESEVTVSVFAEGTPFGRKMNVEFGGGSVNSRVLALAKTAFEGELMELYKTSLENSSDCTAQKYVERMKKFFELNAVNYPEGFDYDFDLTQEELDVLDEQIKEVERCKLSIKESFALIDDSKYSVSYSLVVGGDCTTAQGYSTLESQEDVIIIEVDLKNNSTEVTKGAMSTANITEQQMRLQLESFRIMGGCFKAMMLGVNPLQPDYDVPPQDVVEETELKKFRLK